MVLKTLVLVVLCAGLWGCSQSLFDSHAGDDDGSGSGSGSGSNGLPSVCPAPCLGDAGSNFDGTAMGSTGNWRYVEDQQDRTWTPMTAGMPATGAVSGNAIKSCGTSTTGACADLPGALLVSSAGGAGPVSALEWIAPANRVVQLQLGIRLPDGAASQVVRLYRSSREDALFNATVDAGVTISNIFTLDVIAGDRLYVTLDGPAVTDVGVQLFVVGDAATFPSTCQLAISFDVTSTMTSDVVNQCGTNSLYTMKQYTPSQLPVPVTSMAGPFAEAGMAANIPYGDYFDSDGTVLDHGGDFTVQFWMNWQGLMDAFDQPFPFSDMDGNSATGGGIGAELYDGTSTTQLAAATVDLPQSNYDPIVSTPYTSLASWHFIRLSYTKATSQIVVCVDGAKKASQIVNQSLKTTIAPQLGKTSTIGTQGAFYKGGLDEVRAVTQALPCN